jgi:hypothetical protein
MNALSKLICVLCLVAFTTTGALAAEGEQLRERKPGYALAAAGMNILFMPIRLVVNVIGAELSGLTGFLTLGNQQAAGDVASMFDGSMTITPEIVEGTEPLRFGPPRFP